MHSIPQETSRSRSPCSLKRATATMRLPGAARLASRAKRRTDLAAGAEDNEVAADVAEFLHHAGRGRGHHLLEMLHVAEAFGQCCGAVCHGEINLVRHDRARPGHPRLGRRAKDMDARDKPAHDGDTVAARFSPQTDAVAWKR